MSREIKFRAWLVDPFEKIEHFVVYPNGHLAMTTEGTPFPIARDEYILEQYTGLKDSDGVEIYEGDIVQFTYWWFDGNHTESQLTGQIVYSNELMSFQMKGVKNKEWERFTGHENDNEYLTAFSELRFEEDDFKVLGNIHEHPNLLEGE